MRLCDRYDVLLIIDEVKTGFRVAKGGVQELFGVKADLCTFAKAIGNGYPISILAGREDIMRTLVMASCMAELLPAHSVSLAAAAKTLEILDETTALADIRSYGRSLQVGLSEILKRRGIPHSFTGHPSLMGLFFATRRRVTIANGYTRTTSSTMRSLPSYMSWGFSSSRIHENPGSCARLTMWNVSPKRWTNLSGR